MSGTLLRLLSFSLLIVASGTAWAARRGVNDNFGSRIVLAGNSVSTTGSNVGNTLEPSEPLNTATSGGRSAWWSWTAPAHGDVTIDTVGSSYDTTIGVYTGSSVSTLTRIASNDDFGASLTSSVSFFAVAGTDYRISVDGWMTSTGTIQLNINNVPSTVAYRTDFDSGAAGWTFDAPVNGSAWAVDATPATFPSGVSRTGLSLNFNNGVDYAGGTSGGAMSPLISLAGVTNPVLEFWCNYNTDCRGTQFDRRTLQVWNSTVTVKLTEWQLASVGYTFNAAGGIVGVGPGPCGEAYIDLETGAPVTSWHMHRIYLDPAWGSCFLRFVFWSVDDLRNNYAGWAIDDLMVRDHATPAPTGWPDNSPDFTNTVDDPGYELEDCRKTAAGRLEWSWGCTNFGDLNVHMIIGNHPQSILHESFMFFDTNHGHYHLSQYADFSLWKTQAFGFQKLRRGPKRSFCLTDVNQVIPLPPASISPGCGGVFQAITYGFQDVYARGTAGQDMDISGIASGTDYYLVGVIDPLNRLREKNNMNNNDQIHFTMPVTPDTPVPVLDHGNPYPPTATALSITSATLGTFQGNPSLHLIGTGFDTTLVPILYDTDTTVTEAPFVTIVSTTDIWVDIPTVPTLGTLASIELIRPRGDSFNFRIGGSAPVATPPPGPPTAGPLAVAPAGGLTFSGAAGGPFSPTRNITITNNGSAPLIWEALKHEGWVSFSSSTSTLGPGGSTIITASISAAANGLAPDSYSDPVFFVNRTNGTGSTVLPLNLTVTGAAPQMTVSPTSAFSAIGLAGGPFTPTAVYSVQNTGTTSLDWTAAKTQPWVSLSSAGGTLAAGGTSLLTASFAAAANALAAGRYADTITFVNTTNAGGNTTRSVSLDVVTTAPPTLTITAPPATATSTPLAVGGTAAGTGLSSVAWSNSATGGSGAGTGTTNWSSSVGLANGLNSITITVFDSTGDGTSQTFVVDATLPVPVAKGGGGGGGGCGATGLEAALLLGLLPLLRRRR